MIYRLNGISNGILNRVQNDNLFIPCHSGLDPESRLSTRSFAPLRMTVEEKN